MTREEIAAYRVDRSGWGDGPWQKEGDRLDFVHAGLPCLALRHPSFGFWCGYAGVPKGHRLYGLEYGEVPEEIEAHGGLTYSAACDGDICHLPEPGMSDEVWWLGFDCGHAFDLAPGMLARERSLGIFPIGRPSCSRDVYRDLPYVRHEIERLAEQLAAIV